MNEIKNKLWPMHVVTPNSHTHLQLCVGDVGIVYSKVLAGVPKAPKGSILTCTSFVVPT